MARQCPPAARADLPFAGFQLQEVTEELREEWRPTAADQLLAFTCCWPELPTAVSVPQPGPEGRQDQPPAWPLILLPLALCAMWSKKLRQLVAPDFGLLPVSSWWRWWRVPVRRGAHYVSGGRRAQQPADGVSPAQPPSAQRPTKLASIEGAVVPLVLAVLDRHLSDRWVRPGWRLGSDEVHPD